MLNGEFKVKVDGKVGVVDFPLGDEMSLVLFEDGVLAFAMNKRMILVNGVVKSFGK